MSEHGAPAQRPAGEAAPITVSTDPFEVTPPPDSPADQPRRRPSRARLIVLGSVMAIVILLAVTIGAAGWRIMRQKDANLVPPDTVAGLRRDTSDQATNVAEYLGNALAAEVDLDNSVGVVYVDPAKADAPAVLFFGGTALFWTPENDLDTAFKLLADDTGAVTGLAAVPAGPLGGVMKCGDTSEKDVMAVCGWADHGSLALAMFPKRGRQDAAPLMREIRDRIEQRH